jgi:hypothetical protein
MSELPVACARRRVSRAIVSSKLGDRLRRGMETERTQDVRVCVAGEVSLGGMTWNG